jgi:hypothetical protein
VLWDVNNKVAYQAQVSKTTTTITGLLPGMYTVSVYSKNITTPVPDITAAAGTSRRDYTLISPGVPSGATYATTIAAASYN